LSNLIYARRLIYAGALVATVGLTDPAMAQTPSEDFKFNYDSAYGQNGLSLPIVNPSSITGVICAQMLAQSGPNQRVEGQVPQSWRPGTGTIITGADAENAKAAALARYPGGTVNRVLKLSDGSYAVHMIKIRWPHHVFVSKNFEVTGAVG
jgi:hypothetical protein